MEVQGPDTTLRRIQGLLFLACWWYMGAICIFCPSSQNQVTGRTSVDPLPPPKPTWAKPPPPLRYLLHPLDRWRSGQPRRNHTSASDSRSEAADWARGGCGDHFGLFSAPVRGQGAELEASAGWSARFFIALLYTISGTPGRAGTTKTHPWYGARVYIRNPCVPSYHSAATSGGDHISSHIEKKHHPTRSEGEHCWDDLKAKTVRRTPLFNVYLIYVLCSLFFAPLCTGFDFQSV